MQELISQTRANSATHLRNDGSVERVDEQDTTYLTTAGVLAKEDVYTYPRANERGIHSEYLAGDALDASEKGWEGVPILLDHPTDENGHATVIDQGTDEPIHIGEVRQPSTADDPDGATLTGEVWLDLDNSGQHDGDFDAVVDSLDAGEVVETSAAYRANRQQERGSYDGEQYQSVQRPLLPDHVAVFSPESGKTGNCSVESGCGVGRANEDAFGEAYRASIDDWGGPPEDGDYVSADDLDNDTAASIGRRVIEAVGLDDWLGRSNEDTDVSNSDESAETDSDTGVEETPDDDSNMQDTEKISYLVDEHNLDRENMEPLKGEDCLDNIYQTYANEDEGEGGSDGDSSGADSGGESNEQMDAIANQVADIADSLSDVQKYIDGQKEETKSAAAEQLAEAHGIDAESIDISTEAAESLLEDARANSQQDGQYNQYARANMAGVGGVTGREESEDNSGYVSARQDNERFTGGDD